jgi:hypothetical protein
MVPGRVDAPDPVVAGVGDVHAAVGVGGHVEGQGQLRRERVAAVAGRAAGADAGEGVDVAGRVDHADALVVRVGNEHVAVGVHGEAERPIDLRQRRRATVTGEPADAGADDGRDGAVGVDACGCDGCPSRDVQDAAAWSTASPYGNRSCASVPWPVVAAVEPCGAGPGKRGDDAVGADAADAVVRAIGEDDPVLAVDGQEIGCRTYAAIAGRRPRQISATPRPATD